MATNRHTLYSNICKAVLDYGELANDNNQKLKNVSNSEDAVKLTKEVTKKYYETMGIINEYLDFVIEEERSRK